MDLDRDLPTTPEDIAALRRASCAVPPAPVDYLAFLETFGDPPAEALRARRGPRADRPFELPAP
ncbi:MAG: hypothetical protein SCH98_13835 [Deferrisomatales bacterium]|nr:hypothetical protein [Deferrisomatales bacterium]